MLLVIEYWSHGGGSGGWWEDACSRGGGSAVGRPSHLSILIISHIEVAVMGRCR